MGPNSPTQGVPTAAAKCSGPVSELTISIARRAIAASSRTLVGGASLAQPPGPAAISSAQAFSFAPAQTIRLGNPRVWPKCAATAANLSAGHSFDGQPAPGLSKAN